MASLANETPILLALREDEDMVIDESPQDPLMAEVREGARRYGFLLEQLRRKHSASADEEEEWSDAPEQ